MYVCMYIYILTIMNHILAIYIYIDINHHEPSIVRGGMIVGRSEAIPFSVPASNYLATALRLTNTPTARGPVASLWGEAVGMLGKT